jgi:hypothetical protein
MNARHSGWRQRQMFIATETVLFRFYLTVTIPSIRIR